MKKLSKEKQQHLVLVGLVTAGLLGGIWFGVVRAQQDSLRALAGKQRAAQQQLEVVQRTIANAASIESQLAEMSQRLATQEEGMAAGDLYAWAFNTLRQFKTAYKVEIPQFSQVDGPKEVTLLPRFPYKQATLTIAGTASYYDLGRFIADFENQFPLSRVLNLSLEPTPEPGSEKLLFRMDIAALVKSGIS